MTALPRLFALLIAIAAFAAIGIRIAVDMAEPGASIGAVLWSMARFFTVLTNLLVGLTFGAIALTGRAPSVWTAILTVSIVVVGIVYHLLLADLLEFTGAALVSDTLFHTIVPAACLLWWIIFAPKSPLQWRQLPFFAAWPAVYVVYALGRAQQDGTYPYPFLNIDERGVGPVAVTCGIMLVGVLVGGGLMILSGRIKNRSAAFLG